MLTDSVFLEALFIKEPRSLLLISGITNKCHVASHYLHIISVTTLTTQHTINSRQLQDPQLI